MVAEAGRPRTLVLGIGNVLMGDEGVGVHVVRALQAGADAGGADVVDGGTGGIHLLEYFETYERILLVDATVDGKPTGTLTVLRPRFSPDYPPTLTAHDLGLKDLLDIAALMNHRPDVVLFAISVRPIAGPSLDLSAEARAAIPEVTRAVLAHLSPP